MARLMPVGYDTQKAFDWLMQDDGLSQYHRDYVQAKPLSESRQSHYASTADVNLALIDPAADLVKRWIGYFQLIFDHSRSESP